jgi:MFS family permease
VTTAITPIPTPSPHRWRSTVVLGFTVIVASAEIGIVTAIFPVLRNAFGLTMAHLGIFLSIGLLARTIFGPLWGLLADQFGRKYVLLLAVLGWSVCTAAAGFTKTDRGFLVLYSLGVIGAVASEPIVNSILSDLFPPADRGKAFGVLRALTGCGIAVRVPIFGWLAGFTDGWRWSFILLGTLQIVGGLLLVFGVKEPKSGESETVGGKNLAPSNFNLLDVPALWRIPSVRLFALNYALATSIVMFAYLPTFLTEIRGYSVQTSTRMYGLMHAGIVIGAFAGGWLSDWVNRLKPRSGRIVLMQAYLIVFAAMAVLIFQVPWRAPTQLSALLFVFGVIFPVGFSGCVLPMLSAVVRPELRSTGFGLLESFVQGLSLTIVSALAGVLADHIGLQQTLFWVITAPYLLNAGVWSFLYRKYPRDAAMMQQQLEAGKILPTGGE